MELIIEDTNGRVIGSRDLEGSCWEQIGPHFVNLQKIVVAIAASGEFGGMYIKNGNERINGEAKFLRGRLNEGSSIILDVGSMPLSWHEIRKEISDYGVQGNTIDFSRDAARDVRQMAEEVEHSLPDINIEIVRSLLAKVYDLLASLDMIGVSK